MSIIANLTPKAKSLRLNMLASNHSEQAPQILQAFLDGTIAITSANFCQNIMDVISLSFLIVVVPVSNQACVLIRNYKIRDHDTDK